MHHWKAALLAAVLVGAPALAQTADLAVVLDGGATPALTIGNTANPGPPGTFTVTVSNAGPNTSGDITVNAALPDNTSVTAIDPTCVTAADSGTFPCTLSPLANGGSVTFGFQVAWAVPVPLPTTCPTNLDLGATVSSTTTDPNAGNNTSTVAGITVPVADLTGTASGPAMPLPDGGATGTLPLPGATLAFTGSVTNNGPCAVPAGGLTLDGSFVDTFLNANGAFGLTFVSGSGDCSTWSVSTPPAPTDGVCTDSNSVASGQTINFSVQEQIQPLAPASAGGNSIIQSAVTFQYLIQYAGNPAVNSGDVEAPSSVTLVKGPASSCAVAGEGVTAVPFLFSAIGVALWMRRRRSR
jgi:uncharacterized repeat protein (TIGR01451 family)